MWTCSVVPAPYLDKFSSPPVKVVTGPWLVVGTYTTVQRYTWFVHKHREGSFPLQRMLAVSMPYYHQAVFWCAYAHVGIVWVSKNVIAVLSMQGRMQSRRRFQFAALDPSVCFAQRFIGVTAKSTIIYVLRNDTTPLFAVHARDGIRMFHLHCREQKFIVFCKARGFPMAVSWTTHAVIQWAGNDAMRKFYNDNHVPHVDDHDTQSLSVRMHFTASTQRIITSACTPDFKRASCMHAVLTAWLQACQ